MNAIFARLCLPLCECVGKKMEFSKLAQARTCEKEEKRERGVNSGVFGRMSGLGEKLNLRLHEVGCIREERQALLCVPRGARRVSDTWA